MSETTTELREGTRFEGFMRNADGTVICVQCAEGRHSECPQMPDLPSGDPGNAPLEGWCCECGCDYTDTGPARDAKALDAIAQLMSDDDDWNADTASAIHHIVIGTGRQIRTLVDDDDDETDEAEQRAGLAPAACFCPEVDNGTEHYHD